MNERRSLRLKRLHVVGFGRLRDYVLEPAPVPGVLIVAPNEAGKTTVAAAIYHGLFGFVDRELEDLRRPWEGGDFRVALEWAVGDDVTCRVERDFDTHEVAVEWRKGDSVERRWEGTPNPRGRSADRAAYDAELRRILGFASRDIFHQTAFVGPGDPGVRPLASELLRLLSGSERADFRTALAEFEVNYYTLTRFDIEGSGQAVKQKTRRLEELLERRDDLVRRREAAHAVAAVRRRAEEDLERVRGRLAAIERELEERAEIRRAIGRLSELRREIEVAEERRAELESGAARFVDWERKVRTRTAELEPLVRYLHVPDDFPERARRLEALEREIVEIRDEMRAARAEVSQVPGLALPRVATVAGIAVGAGGAAGLSLGLPTVPSVAAAGAGLVGAIAGAWWWRRRLVRKRSALVRWRLIEQRARAVEGGRDELDASLPHEIDRDDLSAEVERYRRAHELRHDLDLMQEMRKSLGDREEIEREKRRVKEESLDVLRLERKRILEAHPRLEIGPDYEGTFLREVERLEEERRRLEGKEIEARGALADAPVPKDDPHHLADRIEALDEERERLELDRDAYRLAWSTLVACKDDFVGVMTRRLEHRIGRVFGEMTEGRYHAVAIDPATLELSVDGDEKKGVPAENLSRGARDQLYFALRVAVLEELATDRALPIVLDDPFLHFDRQRLARVEETLARLGETHQILLFTHDTRLAGWTFPKRWLPELSGRTVVAPNE